MATVNAAAAAVSRPRSFDAADHVTTTVAPPGDIGDNHKVRGVQYKAIDSSTCGIGMTTRTTT